MKVFHVINNLYTGGAETMLYRLLSRTDCGVFETEVVSLIGIGPIGQKIQALGVSVRSLGMRRGVPNPLAVLRLARWLQQDPSQVVQTWMYHADLVGGLAAKLAGSIPVAWGIRHSTFDSRGTKRMSIWTAMACARLSRWLPARIVCCSEASRRVHTQLGYAADKMVVIPNGFDVTAFRPDPSARRSVRQELGIPEEAPLIGLVARFHPQKDHRNFVQAAAELTKQHPDVHFVLVGPGIEATNDGLSQLIRESGLVRNIHLLGERSDISEITAGLDIASLSSAWGEAFPNVIGEAMACGVPCVVTDIGDSARIVDNTGIVVPPRNPNALADAWDQLIKLGSDGRAQLGRAARQRIVTHFSLPEIVRRYEKLYVEVVAQHPKHLVDR